MQTHPGRRHAHAHTHTHAQTRPCTDTFTEDTPTADTPTHSRLHTRPRADAHAQQEELYHSVALGRLRTSPGRAVCVVTVRRVTGRFCTLPVPALPRRPCRSGPCPAAPAVTPGPGHLCPGSAGTWADPVPAPTAPARWVPVSSRAGRVPRPQRPCSEAPDGDRLCSPGSCFPGSPGIAVGIAVGVLGKPWSPAPPSGLWPRVPQPQEALGTTRD